MNESERIEVENRKKWGGWTHKSLMNDAEKRGGETVAKRYED